MVDEIRVVCFAYGNIVDGDNGVRYDKSPVKVVVVPANVSYEQLLSRICRGLGIDTGTHRVELVHRCPVPESAGVYYFAVPINDDNDVGPMLLSVQQHGGVGAAVQVFVKINSSPPERKAFNLQIRES